MSMVDKSKQKREVAKAIAGEKVTLVCRLVFDKETGEYKTVLLPKTDTLQSS